MLRGVLTLLLVGLAAITAGNLALRGAPPPVAHAASQAVSTRAATGDPTRRPDRRGAQHGVQLCPAAPAFVAAASQNARSLQAAAWSVFHRPETGWETYAPLVSHEIGPACGPRDAGFAAALANWQRDHHLASTGVMDAPTLRALANVWQSRRPFVAASLRACPAPPTELAAAQADESYGATARLRPAALAAYRRMVAAARAAEPELAGDRRMLTIFSGYRDPAADAARCVAQQNCDSIVRAPCSAHRTGLAVDLYLGAAPGFAPDSTADPNRLYLSRSKAYRWLVANAAQYGFVNYPFEPWHWEWTGEAL